MKKKIEIDSYMYKCNRDQNNKNQAMGKKTEPQNQCIITSDQLVVPRLPITSHPISY